MRLLTAAAFMVLLGCSFAGTGDPSAVGADAAAQEGDDAALPPLRATEPGGQPIIFNQIPLELRPPGGEQQGLHLRVYDAADHPSRGRGLMQVRSLPDDSGMLFRFGRPQEGGFWMKNTVMPLSIAFADERGVINDILDMQPCTADPCEIYRPDHQYAYALEVPQGAFDRWNVVEGWTLLVPDDLPAAD